jgi:signal transduction histidine kinase
MSDRVIASVAMVLGVAAVLAGLVGLLYGRSDALITFGLLAPPAVAAVLLAHAAVARRERLGPLRRQFGLVGALAAGHLVVAVAAGAAVMFVSRHDAVLALVIVALGAIVGLRTLQLLATGVLADVDRLRGTLVAVGEGARDPAPVPVADDELADLTLAANATIARLADAESTRRDLIAAVSHDLRTPVTSLRLLAEAVDDGVVTGTDRADYLRQIRLHVGTLSALIDDLFELSRLEAGDIAWAVEQVRLDELLGGAVEAMRPEADARMVRVMAALDELGPIVAHGSPERLRRVLFNLIQNAIRHTPADGSVTVTAVAARDGFGGVEVEVADTGPGIPVEERPRVFDAFYRGDASRSADGAGLGLAICRAIIEAHGGRIWLEEAVRGTRVRFSLPAAAIARAG